MTDPDDYRNNRAMYEADTTAMVKCVTCGEWTREDFAAEYKGDWYHCDCAHQAGLCRCDWCGSWDEECNLKRQGEYWVHEKCLDEMARRGR